METTVKPRWRRKVLGVPVLAWLAVVVVAGAALAAFLLTALISGSVTTGNFEMFSTDAGTIADGDETNGDCIVARTGVDSDLTYSVVWNDGPIAGDTCTATLGLAAGNNAVSAEIQAVNIGPSITGGEISATLDGDGQDDCGVLIAPNASYGVTVTFTITQLADPGTVYDLTGTALEIVPVGSAVGLCT